MDLDSQLTLDQCSVLRAMRPNIGNKIINSGSFVNVEEVGPGGQKLISHANMDQDKKGSYCGGQLP